MPTDRETAALVDAMSDLLMDMAENGTSVCGFAKAKARIAFEPFLEEPEADLNIMPLEEAKRIFLECDVGWPL